VVKKMVARTFIALAFTVSAAGAFAQPTQPPAAPKLPVPGQSKPEFDIPAPDRPGGKGTAGPAAQPAGPIEGYVIGSQDLLSITVTEEPDLTQKYRVDTDGTISMPYLQRVPIAGLTLADAQSKIATLLRNGFLKNPQVRVEVDQFKSRKVTVTGEVRQPGPIGMNASTMTLLEALALAGSPSSNASNDVIVQHKPKNAGDPDPPPVIVNRKDLELGRSDIPLQDGDVINIPIAKRFYISGFVKNSGSFVLDTGTTVSQAIIMAGGLAERGTDRRIKVMRVVSGKTVEISVELDDKVQPNDEIKISARFF
jgi:polysaccharide export outer membrane protein